MEPVLNPDLKLTTSDLLDAIPMRNREVRSESRNGKGLILSVPLQRRWYMKLPLSSILPFSSHRRVSLDPFGIEVWNNCDGKKTMERIVETFAAHHNLSFHEARLSVMLFLRDLMKRGMIVIVGAADGRTDE